MIALQTLEICAPCFPESVLRQIEAVLGSLADLLGHNSAAVRHLSARCLAALVSLKGLRISVISLVVDKVRIEGYLASILIMLCA